MRRELMDGGLLIEERPGYLWVWHKQSAQTPEETHAVLDAIDQALADWGLRRLMFDSRDADRSPPEIGAIIWQWLQDHQTLERCATLLESRDLKANVDIGGASRRLRIRAFHEEQPAARWLTVL